MAKYLFVVPPFFGHISPLLTIGARLLAKGHGVIWTGLAHVDDKLLPGKNLYWLMEEEWEAHREQIEHILALQDLGASYSVFEAAKMAMEDTAIPFTHIMLPGVQRAIDKWKPDFIVSDCLALAGGVAAHLNNIPLITTVPVPPDVGGSEHGMTKLTEWHLSHIYKMQEEYGIRGEEIVVQSKLLCLNFTSSSFACITNIPSYAKFVGPISGLPLEVPFDWDAFNKIETPKIYVTIGTLLKDIRKTFFSRIIKAFGGKPVTIIAATDPELFESWPENFIVQKFLPQSQVIKQSDVVICHGGFNTVNESLLYGVPILITPIAYDQFHTANLIIKAGCGISVKYKRLRDGDLETALDKLLNDRSYKDAALEVQKSFLEAGGCEKAVEYLEQLSAMS